MLLLMLIMLAAALPASLGYLRASIYILKMPDREKQIPSVFRILFYLLQLMKASKQNVNIDTRNCLGQSSQLPVDWFRFTHFFFLNKL